MHLPTEIWFVFAKSWWIGLYCKYNQCVSHWNKARWNYFVNWIRGRWLRHDRLVILKIRLHIVWKIFFWNFFLLIFICLSLSHIPPNKSEFAKHIKNVLAETGVSGKQQRYLLGELKINLPLDEKNKSYRANVQNAPPLTKDYLDFCFSFSLELLILVSVVICHTLTNSSVQKS